MRRALRWLAVGLGVIAVSVTAASIALLVLTWHVPRPGETTTPSLGLEIADRAQFAVVAVIGAFIAARRPGNPIGWIGAVGALGFPLQNLAEGYALHTLAAEPGGLPGGMAAAWGGNWLWTITYPMPALLFLLFPTGRPASPRWRLVVWAAVGFGAAALVTTAIRPGPLFAFPDIDNPVGLAPLAAAGEALVFVPIVGLQVCFLLGAVSLVLRFRRAGAEERAQIKWLMFAASLFVLFIAAGSSTLFVAATPSLVVAQRVGSIVVGVALSGAIAVAILRYRLYDIDRVISRALSYALLTAVLAGVYGSGVVLLGRLLAPLTTGSDLAIAGATLAAAALFAPARRRIQTVVDHRFNRARYDAQGELDAFRARLRAAVVIADVGDELLAATSRTVQPAAMSLWVAEEPKR